MHTPGPWINGGAVGYGILVSSEARLICVVYGPPGVEFPEGNANLIAAAPELLAALKEVVRLTDRKTDIWDAAKAAISKAEAK